MARARGTRLHGVLGQTAVRRGALASCLACMLLASLAPAAGAVVFANTTPITIPATGNATPYPSSIVVSGLTGQITDVNVTLHNYSHTDPEDVAAVLVPPSGTNVLLMDGPGGVSEVSGVNVTFDDSAPGLMPQTTAFPSGSYRPSAYFTGTSFPAPGPLLNYCNPGPAGGGSCTLGSALNGNNPNGTWSLYLVDVDAPDTGLIAGGWSLDITSGVLVQRTLTVSRGGTGAGSVTTAGINCGTDCTEAYSQGTSVVLTAAATAGSSFSGWTGCDAPSAATCTMSMTANKTVTASFSLDPPVGPPTPPDPGPTPPGVVPTPPGAVPAPQAADTAKPLLSALAVAPLRSRAGRSGPSIASAGATNVSYRLSEVAAIRFRVERVLSGRLVGGRCVKASRSNRRARRCTRYQTLTGSFTHQGLAGTNKFRFSGRLAGRALKPGAYRLSATATDQAGNRSLVKRGRFRIVRS